MDYLHLIISTKDSGFPKNHIYFEKRKPSLHPTKWKNAVARMIRKNEGIVHSNSYVEGTNKLELPDGIIETQTSWIEVNFTIAKDLWEPLAELILKFSQEAGQDYFVKKTKSQ